MERDFSVGSSVEEEFADLSLASSVFLVGSVAADAGDSDVVLEGTVTGAAGAGWDAEDGVGCSLL